MAVVYKQLNAPQHPLWWGMNELIVEKITINQPRKVMISQSFRHLFHTVLQSEDDLHSVLSIDHLYDTLNTVVNVKELFIPDVVSVDSRE